MEQNHAGRQKYILKRDVRMPNNANFGARAGTVVPAGTVFYKAAVGYRPWFHTGPEGLALDDQDFVAERADDSPDQATPGFRERKMTSLQVLSRQAYHQGMNKPYFVRAEWDADAGVWVATSDDVPGLVTESETIEALDAKLKNLVPELLEANGCMPADGQVVVELLARRFSVALPAAV